MVHYGSLHVTTHLGPTLRWSAGRYPWMDPSETPYTHIVCTCAHMRCMPSSQRGMGLCMQCTLRTCSVMSTLVHKGCPGDSPNQDISGIWSPQIPGSWDLEPSDPGILGSGPPRSRGSGDLDPRSRGSGDLIPGMVRISGHISSSDYSRG